MKGLDFGKSRMVKGRGLSVPMSRGARMQAVRGVPQAVVKVVSYGHGMKGVRQSIDYISRKGELALETESGDIVLGRAEQKELVKNWSRDFDSRKRSRDSVHLAFSMPRGSDPEKLRAAVRKVITDHFDGHEAVFAIHQDRPHPHAHVVMKTRNRNTGKKLRLGITEIFQTREAFAKAACEQGIELAASSRAARGVGRKGVSQAVCQLRRKGITPKVDQEAEQSWARDLVESRWEEKPWEKAMAERNKREREAYRQEAEKLRKDATLKSQQESQRILKDAQLLEQFAQRMPKAKSRRQEFMKEQYEKIMGQRKFNIQRPSRGEEMEL